MTVTGTVRVECPACGREQTAELVQSLNPRANPELVQRLVRGELNRLDCACGKRTQLVATLLFHDPDADYFCQVCPGGEDAMARGAAAFAAIGATGTRRLVPTPNALVEKVKLLAAGLDDRAIEMAKVLLLASLGDHDLDRVLLFEGTGDGVLRWVLGDRPSAARPGEAAARDPRGGTPRVLTSPRAAYERLAARLAARPPSTELRIDRAWAVEAVRAMIGRAS